MMFGHQDTTNPQQDNHAAAPEPQADATLAHNIAAPTPVAPTTLPSPATSFPSVAAASDDDHVTPAASSAPTINNDDDNDTAGDYIMTDPHPVVSTPTASPSSPSVTPAAPAPDTDDLLELKQGALQQLSPLLDHLDQTPEEKFRTTMMMIQATDNHAMLKTAYEAAQKIEDEKVRAQALLDVVNEINYFTQQNGDTEKSEDTDEPSL